MVPTFALVWCVKSSVPCVREMIYRHLFFVLASTIGIQSVRVKYIIVAEYPVQWKSYKSKSMLLFVSGFIVFDWCLKSIRGNMFILIL